ncbi:MAG: hypothetical protein R2705_24865 [Ilumatobacteraceae bacterium]
MRSAPDTVSFGLGLRAALREDRRRAPRRDARPGSIQVALSLAETSLVFATLHTNDASQALDRMVDVFPAKARPRSRRCSPVRSGGVVSAAARLLPAISSGASPPTRC